MRRPSRLARPLRTLAVAAAALAVGAGSAAASEITPIGRNTSAQTLKVNARGTALVEYRQGGARQHILLWGAVNAGPGVTGFRMDYSGGWKSKRADWRHFRNTCRPYDGPALNAVVAACKAPDGSYWALQDWTKLKDEYGGTTTFRGGRTARELHLSHWTGEIAQLDVRFDWRYSGRFHHLFGRYTYQGAPVHGFRTDRWGNPQDKYGRNLYLDTLDGDGYPGGWSRVNSFVAQKPGGNFCFLFSPKSDAPGFTGTKDGWRYSGASRQNQYRISVLGPGVTPDLVNIPFTDPLTVFDPTANADLIDLAKQYADPGTSCWPSQGA